jgi:hypothetical protein
MRRADTQRRRAWSSGGVGARLATAGFLVLLASAQPAAPAEAGASAETGRGPTVVASAEPSSASAESVPTLGTLAWAEAVEKARDDFSRTDNAAGVVARARRLLALYHGCTTCREQTYRMLDYKLKEYYRDENTLATVQEIYRNELREPTLQREHGWSESDLRHVETMLDGYIERLESSGR